VSRGADGALRFDVITLFPELFAPFLEAGVARRAYASGQIDLKLWNPRDYADGNYRRVDDRPFGGGPGMVMLAEPLARCLAAAQAERADGAAAPKAMEVHARLLWNWRRVIGVESEGDFVFAIKNTPWSLEGRFAY